MAKRMWLLPVAALTLAIAGCAKKTQPPAPPAAPAAAEAVTIAKDTTIRGDYTVQAGKPVVVKRGAKLTVEGKLNVAGELRCEGGTLAVEAKGTTAINGTIRCPGTNGQGGDVTLVVGDAVTFGPDAQVAADGNVQLVSRADLVADTAEEIERLFQEAASPTGEGNRFGPFTSEPTAADLRPLADAGATPSSGNIPLPPPPWWKVPAAEAASHTVVVTGSVSVGTPPPGVRRIVVFNFPDAAGVNIKNFELSGPDGRPGADDKGASCNARGKDGEDAFRLLVVAPNITVSSFKLKLGNGGKGGDAETTTDCKPGIAVGGKGGKPSNFKMIAGNDFKIIGPFAISTGNGGAGGSAIAHGKDGGPSEDGGDARATGGAGGDNVKELSIAGTVSGTSNVTFDSTLGGDGGMATADPGTGGDGKGCGKRGGKGGDGTATGGKGGKASLTVTGGAGRTAGAKDSGGNGGDADAHAAQGGDGGDCDPKGPGGPGGKGGDATAKPGKGGVGKTTNGSDGDVKDETGGDGGTGGDGCKEGKGGTGGKGNPPGKDGKDGKNLCLPPAGQPLTTPPTPTPTPTPVAAPSPSPSPVVTTPQPTPTPVAQPKSAGKTIRAIQYQGKYLPVDQLIIENEAGCGVEHWHAVEGAVRATDGTMVPDPGPQCGYGKTTQTPVIEVEVEASAE